jgi:hypothetical protein
MQATVPRESVTSTCHHGVRQVGDGEDLVTEAPASPIRRIPPTRRADKSEKDQRCRRIFHRRTHVSQHCRQHWCRQPGSPQSPQRSHSTHSGSTYFNMLLVYQNGWISLEHYRHCEHLLVAWMAANDRQISRSTRPSQSFSSFNFNSPVRASLKLRIEISFDRCSLWFHRSGQLLFSVSSRRASSVVSCIPLQIATHGPPASETRPLLDFPGGWVFPVPATTARPDLQGYFVMAFREG